MRDSAGKRFREATDQERPLQVVGVVNAYCALLAQQAGFRALYLSGAGVANASLGLPDLAVTTLGDVLEDARRITGAADLPLLVDCDTGWGSPLSVARAIARDDTCGRGGHSPGGPDGRQAMRPPRGQAGCAGRGHGRPPEGRAGRPDRSGIRDHGPHGRGGRRGPASRHRPCLPVRRSGRRHDFCGSTDGCGPISELRGGGPDARIGQYDGIRPQPAVGLGRIAGGGTPLGAVSADGIPRHERGSRKVYETVRREGTQRKLLSKMQTREELYRVLDYDKFERLTESHSHTEEQAQ